MLDYEIKHYIVFWKREFAGRVIKSSRKFDTEEEATNFIFEHSFNWIDYRIEKHSTAILSWE